MKVKLLYTSLFLLLVTGFTACKKETGEDRPLREKVIGKWTVEKITVKTGSATPVTTEYGGSDYVDFKNNETDDVEISLKGERTVGSFATTADNLLYLNLTTKNLQCKVVKVSNTEFVFEGNVNSSNPAIFETYYLSRK
jgi:hypothetical protein